jgi:hypothetical protein
MLYLGSSPSARRQAFGLLGAFFQYVHHSTMGLFKTGVHVRCQIWCVHMAFGCSTSSHYMYEYSVTSEHGASLIKIENKLQLVDD